MIRIIGETGVVAYSGSKGALKERGSIMSSWSLKAGFAGVAIVAATAYAVAQMPDHARMHGMMGNPDQQHMMQPGGMRDQMMQGQHRMMMRRNARYAGTRGVWHNSGDCANVGS